MTMQEGNLLIADFMGAKDAGSGWIIIPHRGWGYMKKHYPNQLKYHVDWAWLMPVVEKIEGLDGEDIFTVFIAGDDCDISFSTKYKANGEEYDAPSFLHKEGEKLKSTYSSVIKFIKWYKYQAIDRDNQ